MKLKTGNEKSKIIHLQSQSKQIFFLKDHFIPRGTWRLQKCPYKSRFYIYLSLCSSLQKFKVWTIKKRFLMKICRSALHLSRIRMCDLSPPIDVPSFSFAYLRFIKLKKIIFRGHYQSEWCLRGFTLPLDLKDNF